MRVIGTGTGGEGWEGMADSGVDVVDEARVDRGEARRGEEGGGRCRRET